MQKKVKQYTAEFKTQVALEAIKGDKTIAQLASEYEISNKNIQNWKKEVLENAEMIFKRSKSERTHKAELQEKDKLIDNLYKEVGDLTVQVKWAQKKIKQAGLKH